VPAALIAALPELRASLREVSRRAAIIRLVLHISVTRSLWYSARLRGAVLVARGTILDVGRGARIESGSRAVLLVGFEHITATPAVLHIGEHARLVLDGLVQVMRGARIFIGPRGRLRIGHRSFVNDHAWITCFERVEIGSGVAISWHAHILDSDVHQLIAEGRRRPNTRPVLVGDRVWLGTGAMVLKGVVIAPDSVVAAGAVVSRDVAQHTLVAGNPAQVVRSGVTWRL
jgi:acetyltransferase-like isoleucine patch superfamily enzyme